MSTIDPSSRPLVLLPSTPWDPQTRSTTGPNAVAQQTQNVGAALGIPGSQPAAPPNPFAWGSALRPSAPNAPSGPLTPSGWQAGIPEAREYGIRSVETQPRNPDWSIDQIPAWNAPDYLKPALNEAGINAGSEAPEQPEPLSLVDMAKARQLTEHTYKISDRDWIDIQKLNGQEVNLINAPAPEVRTGYDQAAPMTRQAYESLSEDQKQAVQFNTLLMDARETDLNSKQVLSTKELEQYNKDVLDLFGAGGDSGVIAPTTVKMLKSLDLKLEGQDLDDFLSGEAAVQLNELLDFKLPQTPNMIIKPTGQTGANQDVADFVFTRSAENLGRTTAMAIRNAGELIEKALKRQDIRRPDWLGTVQETMGYKINPDDVPVGWGVPTTRTDSEKATTESFYASVYGYLADANTPNMDRFWAELQARDYKEQDIDDLFAYIDQRSKWEMRTGGSVGTRTGAQIRQFVGLDGGSDG